MGTGVLGDLSSAVDRLVEVEPATLSDREAVVALHRELERLAAVTTRAVAAFDAAGDWGDDAASAASWLAHECRMPSATARARVRLGRVLRHLPVTEAAWLAGEVGEAQAGLLARSRTPAREVAMARDEEFLVGEATRLRFRTFAKVLAYWRWRADPDGAEDESAGRRERRRVHLSQSFEDMWFLEGTLDPLSGEIVARELRRLEEELFTPTGPRPRPGWAKECGPPI